MADSFTKLDQALKDLIEAYSALEEEFDEKYGEDEDAFSSAMIEALETSIENAIDEQDSSTSVFATVLSSLSEALEQLDPAAFEESEEEEEEDEDYDLDDVDYDDLDEEGEIDEDDEDSEDDDETPGRGKKKK